MQKQKSIRPLPHDLLCNIIGGFDIEVKKVIISKIVDNTFCATIMLEQKILDQSGNWGGQRREIHVDSRASDSIIIALKTTQEIWVAREVVDKVENILIPEEEQKKEDKWYGTEIQDINFDIPDFLDEDDGGSDE